MAKELVLIFEDEIDIAEDLKNIMEDEGFDTLVAYTMEDAFALIQEHGQEIQLALLDIQQEVPLVKDAGVLIATELYNVKPTPTIFLTAHPEQFADVLKLKPAHFFEKGVTDIASQIPRAARLAISNHYAGADDTSEDDGNEASEDDPPQTADVGKKVEEIKPHPPAKKICLKLRKGTGLGSEKYLDKTTSLDKEALEKKEWKIVDDATELKDLKRKINDHYIPFEFLIVNIADIVSFSSYSGSEIRYCRFNNEKTLEDIGVFSRKCSVRGTKISILTRQNTSKDYLLENIEAIKLYREVVSRSPDTTFIEYNRGSYINMDCVTRFDSDRVYHSDEEYYLLSTSGYSILLKAFPHIKTKS